VLITLNKVAEYHPELLVELKLDFLQFLLRKAANSMKPWLEEKFVEEIDFTFNKKAKSCPGLYQIFKGKKNFRLSVLRRLVCFCSLSWDLVEENLVSLKSGPRGSKVSPHFPITVDKRLGSIVGHVLGDGSIDSRYSQIFFTNSNPELIREFYYCMKEVFNVEPRIWTQVSGNFKTKSKWIKRLASIYDLPSNVQIGLFYPTVVAKILYSEFGIFAVGHKKFVPTVSSEEFNSAMLRAFYDDEGNVNTSSQSLRVYQDNAKILEDMRSLLFVFGITSSPVHYYLKREKKRGYFSIHRLKNFKLFRDKIGFSSTSKLKDFDKLISSINPHHHNVKP